MPIYTIKCKKCGHTEDIMKNINDEFPKCSKCEGDTEKVFKPINAIWKCTGAYGKGK